MSLREYFTNPLVKLAYSLWNKKASRTNHLNILRDLDQSQYYDPERLRLMQVEKLRNIIMHAYHNSEFWQVRFKDIGLEEQDINNLSDTDDIPKLTREDVINNKERIISRAFSRGELTESVSGGTSGSSLSYYLSRHRIDFRTAGTVRHNLWASYRIGDKLATVWGAPADFQIHKNLKTKVRDLFWGRSIDFDSNILTDEAVRKFCREWDKFRPDILVAYAGGLDFFVKRARDMKLSFAPPRAIITSAEILTQAARNNIEDFFEAKIFNRYGCREFSVIASECRYHNGLHINAETLLLEFEPIDELADKRKHCRVFITDLENVAFPFIRYELGDAVIASDEKTPCPCGRGLPRIDEVGGRIMDYLKLPNGRYASFTAITSTFFPTVRGIIKSRIIQKKIDKILVQIVKNNDFDEESYSRLRQGLARVLGDTVEIELEFLEDISRAKSGKYRFVISEVAE
jgi:phenylacetate-CoA ligase